MILIHFFCFLLISFTPTRAILPLLKRNLAYRSPSLTVDGSELSHDVKAIARAIIFRQSPQRRGMYDNDYPTQSELLAALDGGAANGLVEGYDLAYESYGPDGRLSYTGMLTFDYSVAAGDATDSSVILWTHPVPQEITQDPICLFYQVATSTSFDARTIIDSNYAWTTSDVDYSFKVEAIGLRPLTPYYYRFYACHDHSIFSPVGQFKTMPSANDDVIDKLKMAVFSCSNYAFGFFHAYRQAALTDDVDIAIHVGDYIYEHAGDGSPDSYGDGRSIGRVPMPNKEVFTLEEYRERYRTYHSDKDLQLLRSNKNWLHVWDDHEVADQSFSHGTQNSNNSLSGTHDGVTFTDRKRNAVKTFFEWMPIRQVDTTDGLRIWRNFQYGTLASLSMLDTRQYNRDITDLYYNTNDVARLANDTNRSLMGGKQERWFYKQLINEQQRGTVWKIVAQQIIVNLLHYGASGYWSPDLDYDAWDGYNANRRRMFNTIVANEIDNTIFLSGDSHAFWAYDTMYEEWENKTNIYDPETGRGSIAVELGGTAVTSSNGNFTESEFTAKSRQLVRTNRNLQFAEGYFRGYFTLALNREEARADFWGFQNITLPEQDQQLIASFRVLAGSNRLTRPVNYGNQPISGAVQSQVVQYEKEMWNGTAFMIDNIDS